MRQKTKVHTAMGIHLCQFQLGEVHQHTVKLLYIPHDHQKILSSHLLFGMLHGLCQQPPAGWLIGTELNNTNKIELPGEHFYYEYLLPI